jgi:Zn-dependent peptidase ImmA (M78 family)
MTSPDFLSRFGEDAHATLLRAALWAGAERVNAIDVAQLRRALEADQPPDGSPVQFWTAEAKRILDASLRESSRRQARQVSNRDLCTALEQQADRASKHSNTKPSDSAKSPTEQTVDKGSIGEAQVGSVNSDESLAQQHLKLLGVPSSISQTYTEEDALRVLQGREVAPAIADTIHNKLSWLVGIQVVGFINNKSPQLRWTSNRVLVRTLPEGESSARPLSFPDGSHAILFGRSLQESLICMANVIEYLDVAIGLSRLSFRRRKRERLGFETSARVTAVLRYLLLGQRMNGRLPPAPAQLDRESTEIAGKIAAGAGMFVVAHELGHIAYCHTEAPTAPNADDGKVTTSEVQELQADNWALGVLTQMMTPDEPEPESMALWCAFIGLFATYITEQAIYVRRGGTHPEAWARWALLEKTAKECDERTQRLRAAFMATVAGAIKLDEEFPMHLWQLLRKDEALTIMPSATDDTIMSWDRLQATPLDALVATARQAATREGDELLDLLENGDLRGALGMIVPSEKKRARMLDESLALEFSTLRRAIADAPTTLVSREQESFSVAGARLAARQLGGEAAHG